MNINNINFTSFMKVAEAGSFNKAAEELFITSTALIKQINILEDDLGVAFSSAHTADCGSRKPANPFIKTRNTSPITAARPSRGRKARLRTAGSSG